MTRYLLDTNIISNVTRPQPSPSLIAWLGEQLDSDLFISTLSLAEIRRGILEKERGRKRRELESWFTGPEGPPSLFAGRILPFDEEAAEHWARLMAEGTAKGKPRSAIDMIAASVAAANDCVLVTDNERHFRGAIAILNPMRLPRAT